VEHILENKTKTNSKTTKIDEGKNFIYEFWDTLELTYTLPETNSKVPPKKVRDPERKHPSLSSKNSFSVAFVI